jgi:ankyrin repeat protein
VRLLIKHGADVNAPDWNGKIPLHLACWVSVITARFLLQHRADVKEQNDWDNRSSDANTETIQVLLEHSADVTARDDAYTTPLHLASSMGSPEIMRLLIEHGANINELDGNRKTPLHLVLAGVSV